eukprot:754752-Hanusia_phi.AAC.1
MDEIQLLYEASDEERGRRGDSEEVGTRCQLQVKTGGTRRDIQSMGINLSAAMDGLLCSGRSELEGCEQLEVELDGWLPVSLYNSNNRKILSPYLEPLGDPLLPPPLPSLLPASCSLFLPFAPSPILPPPRSFSPSFP